ncbi:M20 family metallopeptidase [Fictibacillus enclensis]|uniref:M20 family metallopeptidase n=1 Tax=Fictibacillus enclensis TaxID=1017270 RepID=UPI0024BFF2A8|nr:M20 family metallopeptidase [Fictibacillus enclensis]MDM5197886.1 M20 family metallopeptidase [Fictibacillus enclensis]WHY73462.1 M20 family metallopeptidase [Fictibacillus enclensis]
MTVISRTVEEIQELITVNVEENAATYIETSHEIHENPEIGNEEILASRLLTSLLEREGFKVERGVAGHETSFVASKKSALDGPTIAFLAEYDALPGLGHACGHNIIGTSSTAAAIALGSVIHEIGGEVKVFGTPAEEGGENGSAKGSFVKHGLLEGIDAALMFHPGNSNRITGTSLAVDPLDFEYIGKPSHAAAAPEKGINALDAVIQLFVGINALRQHVPDDVKIHGIITHGGDAPNIVPEYAKARFYIRAATRAKLDEVTKKVKGIAEGAALATGATLNVIAFQNQVDNLLLNRSFDKVFQEQLESLGAEVDSSHRSGLGSTDAGNISQVVPTIHPYLQIGPESLVGHTDEFREAAISPAGDHALILGAKSLALTALKLLTDEEVLSGIKQEFKVNKAKELASV